MSQNTISTRFSDAYGVKHPFACAGMAFVGMTPDLCIAVCKAGGIGALGVGLMPPDVLRMMIQGIKQAVDGPFNINFITIFTDPAYIDVCVEEQVPIVSFHWGNPPAEMLAKLKAAGIKIWEQVGSVEAAKTAVASGVDVVIAQGSEAGGHNYGSMPLFTLLPEVIDAAGGAMVLASGGIADGRAVAGALGLGADGVWVGTRLVASVEAFAHDDYKARLVAATGTDTTLSGIFGKAMPGFNPMRVLRNKVVAEYEGREGDAPEDTSGEPVVGHTNLGGEEMDLQRFTNFAPMPPTTGDFDEMPLLSGQGVGQIKAVEPAAQIVERMMADAAGIVSGLKVTG
ncbi:MAG: nitronate monooxygenase [Alphaproteobacteria bacterium]|jgi:NAD(P)H-dependent flavin oxidoreductase YrpB (nitropropane dioxygenase family)|nr:nitronate monooxygenase [Alphaproteobacteria bacterium]MBT4016331.1 nitronate monooxygenase [Alphaproteobacteria bacterium]MBT4964849.1 nitronate monooxygenase [Alphaproteobacteria bacterium]MBT5159241.1 nitronate monooxygenase [Alphaproteobacteria bacterium]MBT5917331.1 nitronate monooxygenase [Alphaproteobacteria bacterium]